MKKKILYLILLLCTVTMPLGVRAYETDSSMVTPSYGGGGGGNGGSECSNTGSTFIPAFTYKGVRITVTNEAGVRLNGSKTVDFVSNVIYTQAKPTYYSGNKFNKREIGNRKDHFETMFAQGLKPVDSNASIRSGVLLDDAGFDISLNLYLNTGVYDWTNVSNELVRISKSESDLKTFLKKFNVTYDQYDSVNWYFIVEPLITIAASSTVDADRDGKCDIVGYAIGTPTEFQRYYQYNTYFKFSGVTKTASPYINYNYMYFERVYFGGSGTSSNHKSHFTGLNTSNSSNVGLIWLGANAKEKKNPTCSSVTIGSSAPIESKFTYYSVSSISGFTSWSGSSKYSGGYYKKDEGYNPNYYINSICYSAPTATTCAKEVTSASKFPLSNGGLSIALESNYNSSGFKGYYNPKAGYDKDYYVNSVCYSAPATTTCSSVITNSSYPPSDGNKEIKLESNYNKGNFLGYYDSSVGYHPNYYVNSTCYTRPSCSDFYYNTRNFNKVSLWRDSETNCCIQYKNASGTDLNRLYRDHPECYSCRYSELYGTPTCSSSNNATTVGDSFEDVGDGNTQTCAYYVASGRVNSASTNLVTRKTINSYCKVVCTETVNVKFPLFNHNYIQQGSYIVWPTNLVFKDESSRLVLHGTANCWYYVDSVGLDQLGRSNKGMADTYLNQCATDFKNSYEGNQNVINYNLEGNFSVKYNDSEYGKSINLVKESTEVASYKRKNNLSSMNAINNATSGYRRDKLNNFVRAVEGITFEVTQTANYVIDSSSGYNYSYKGKYYNKSDDKWGNNYIELDYSSLGLKNELYKGGKLEIDYSYIGGGSKKYSTTQKTYGACEYCTVSAPIKECPAGTKNAGMNLTQIMEMESLSHEEAIAKYCGASLSVCPDDTYYAGSAVTEECLKDGVCKELTCNLHACTTEDECKVLNSCISDQIEMHGKSFEAAKLYCEDAYCGYDPGKRISDSIEYRVIDLKNPFPGVSAKFGVSIFNTNVAGRKPGQNWNSLNLVKKEILNNRGVSGDKIYSLEPLFEFNLTPSVIQRIRSYNDKNPYDDFTLRCTSNQKQACVAKGFNIRSEDYGNVRTLSACQNINNLTNFNSCYNS